MTTDEDPVIHPVIKEGQDAEVERLLATLQQEGKRRKPLIRRSMGLLGIFVFGLLLALFLCIIAIELSMHRPVRPLLPGVLLLLGFIVVFHGFSGSSAQLQVARRLVEIQDKRAVGRLLDIMRWHDRELQDRATRMLLRLLPQMEVADVRGLSRYQSFQLTQALHPYYADTKPEYVIAVLELIERTGDAGALPFVRVLTRMSAETDTRLRVQTAAIRCEAAIEARQTPVKSGASPAQADTSSTSTPSSYPQRRPRRPAKIAANRDAVKEQKPERRPKHRV